MSQRGMTSVGIARARDRLEATEVGTIKGKLRYLAPEMIDPGRFCEDGDFDHRVDVFPQASRAQLDALFVIDNARFMQPNQLGILFFDNYDTRYTGYENLTHLVVRTPPMAANAANVAITVNVLDDEEVRQGIKDYAQWPTIPQLYVDGEFVGGSDIMMEMYQSGELQQLIAK